MKKNKDSLKSNNWGKNKKGNIYPKQRRKSINRGYCSRSSNKNYEKNSSKKSCEGLSNNEKSRWKKNNKKRKKKKNCGNKWRSSWKDRGFNTQSKGNWRFYIQPNLRTLTITKFCSKWSSILIAKIVKTILDI